jgi:hypothetical protein
MVLLNRLLGALSRGAGYQHPFPLRDADAELVADTLTNAGGPGEQVEMHRDQKA